jgi:hypothetical protein
MRIILAGPITGLLSQPTWVDLIIEYVADFSVGLCICMSGMMGESLRRRLCSGADQHERNDGGHGARHELSHDGRAMHAMDPVQRLFLGRDVPRRDRRLHRRLSVQHLDGGEGSDAPAKDTAGSSQPKHEKRGHAAPRAAADTHHNGGTATAVGLFVDGVRLPAYLITGREEIARLWPQVLCMTVGVVVAPGGGACAREFPRTFRRRGPSSSCRWGAGWATAPWSNGSRLAGSCGGRRAGHPARPRCGWVAG